MTKQTTDRSISRRQVLQAAIVGAVGAAGMSLLTPAAAAPKKHKTPGLTTAEMAAIDAALGKKGKYAEAEGVYTIALPRADLHVTIQGDAVPTAFGFGGWMSIKRTMDGKSCMLMSDTVLLQEEVNPLITAGQANGLEVSAIHNHFFYEEPRIFYMHLHGMGEPGDLAERFASAIKDTKLYPANQPTAGPPPAKTGKEIFDLPSLDAIIGYTGAVNGVTYKYTIGRDDLFVTAMGVELTTAIGLNTWASFTGSMDSARVAGDIAMLEHEVNPVIKALRASGIEVVATHNHMLSDNPHMFFLHYLGHGPAIQLAKGFRTALDELGKHKMGDMKMGG
jgi:hypothetical protein